MAQSWEYAAAFTSVVESIFLQRAGQQIARRGARRSDSIIGPESLGISAKPLFPLWRRSCCLVDCAKEDSAHNRIGTERIEGEVLRLSCSRRRDKIGRASCRERGAIS